MVTEPTRVSGPDAEAPLASASPSATSPLEAGAAREVLAGEGRCLADADCVLSSYQPGCCTQACVARALNKHELAARMAAENCAAHKGPCPPPAPCEKFDYRVIAAVCRAQTCATLVERP